MRVLIIEDEMPAANHLVELLKSIEESIEIVGLVDSNQSLMSWYGINQEPDLIISDIELLDGPVFNALDQLQITVPIVFTTAYQDYTLKAFETSGISYLLKPYEPSQVAKALRKFQSFKSSLALSAQDLLTIRQVVDNAQRPYRTKLPVKIGSGIYLLEIMEISAVMTQNGIPYAMKGNGKKTPLSGLISELESSLDPKHFFRINRSEIVNAHFIEKIEAYFNDRLAVKVKGIDEKLIVSGARTPAFRKWFNQL